MPRVCGAQNAVPSLPLPRDPPTPVWSLFSPGPSRAPGDPGELGTELSPLRSSMSPARSFLPPAPPRSAPGPAAWDPQDPLGPVLWASTDNGESERGLALWSEAGTVPAVWPGLALYKCLWFSELSKFIYYSRELKTGTGKRRQRRGVGVGVESGCRGAGRRGVSSLHPWPLFSRPALLFF